MNLLLALLLFVAGLGLVLYFAEKLVESVVGVSLGFGLSPFLISVLFLGFDPENLGVGLAGSVEGVAGIALGSILGAAMVAIALAFGLTALVAPLRFQRIPQPVATLPVLAMLLLGGISLDGRLSRLDGALLLAGFALAIGFLLRLTRRGLDVKPEGEVAEALSEARALRRWQAFGLLLLSIAAIGVGSALLVAASETLIVRLGVSDTAFGMTILAFVVSIEELARELPAALKGRFEITLGNVVGSALAFFLFNAGAIALTRPVPVSMAVRTFHLPLCLVTALVIAFFMTRRRVTRWGGAVLLMLYLVFVTGSYLL